MTPLLYDIITSLAVPPAAAWLAARARHRPLLARFSPRVPEFASRPIWVHACSVGELGVARPVIDALRTRFPDTPLVLTVSTVTAWRMASGNTPRGAALAWFPFDQRHVVSRFFDRLRPRALLLMETEIWPNVTREAAARDIPAIVINARLSDKHYARYRRHARFFRPTFARLGGVAAQHQRYAGRFASLGTDPRVIAVTGNIKFDNVKTEVDAARIETLRRECGLESRDPIIVFGSTRPGDESLAAACWESWKVRYPDASLVIAPRHRDRLHDAMSAFPGPVVLRSALGKSRPPSDGRVLFVDTLGELVDFYALATVAIIGGSFYPGVNGHNPLEPAALGVPAVFGPYMSNFPDPAEVLVRENAAVQLDGPGQLKAIVEDLIDNPARREALGAAARATIVQNRGALDRALDFAGSIILKSDRAT